MSVHIVASDAEIVAAEDRIRKQGPCAFCGGKFARHRLIDAYCGRLRAGEPIESVADDYGTDAITIAAEVAALERLEVK